MKRYSTSNLDLPANREAGLWGVIRVLGFALVLSAPAMSIFWYSGLTFDPAIPIALGSAGFFLLMVEHRHRLMYRVQDLEQEVEELTQTIEELRVNPQGRDE